MRSFFNRLCSLQTVLALYLMLTPAAAWAQAWPQNFPSQPQLSLSFTQVAQTQLAVTTTTGNVAFPSSAGINSNYAYICNTGTATAWVNYGATSAVTAVANSGQAVAPNQCNYPQGFPFPAFVAAITAAGTANLVIIVGLVTQPQLGNYDVGPLITAAAQATGTVNSQDQVNFTSAGVNCFLNVTATSGSPSYNFAIQGKDTTSGVYYDVVRSSANATSGNITTTTFPGQPISIAANLARESFPLPRVWRVQLVVGAGTVTGTAGCSVLL